MAIMVRTYYQGSAAHPTHHRNIRLRAAARDKYAIFSCLSVQSCTNGRKSVGMPECLAIGSVRLNIKP